MTYCRSYLPACAIAAALASPAAAQQDDDGSIIVTAQRDNATQVINAGEAGVLGNQPAEDLPFAIRSFDETLIYNQQPLTIGDVLENDPTVRITYGFGNAAEQFVIRGFSLFGDDLGVNGLYGIAPRQLIAPELFEQVQVLNGSSAFLNGAAPGGSGLGGSVNLQLKRVGEDRNRATATFVGDGHFGGSFDVSRRFGDSRERGVRVNGAYRDGEVSIDRQDRRAQVLGGALDYDGGAFRVALDLAYQDVRVDSLRPKVTLLANAIPDVPDADANYAQDYTFTELTDIFGTLTVEYDIAPDVLVYAKAGARRGDEEGIYGGIQVSDIMFTSGTTGKPKGVLTSHHQAVATFGNWAQRVDLREGDVYLIVNPFFHTFGYKAGWVAALVQGATIVPQQTFDVPQTVRLIEEHGVSFIPGPPTIYQSLLQELAGGKPHDFSTLRVAVTGAAPVAPELVRRMRSELGMRGVVNGYGMTECGAISMTCKDDNAETIANTCGCPLPGLEVRCIDEEGRELPPGAAGEFVVRGHSVMQGYLDDPEATAETIDAEGWLHTGDIGILDERGYLKITDRKKDMFICGGFNVYPAEVERTLAEHPGISACAVIGIADERLGEVSKAFVILRKDAADDVDVASIVAWARKAMANYKVPREVELVEDLPRNAAGKAVKAELRS